MRRKLTHTYRRHERKLVVTIAVAVAGVIATVLFIRIVMIEPVGTKRLVTIYDKGMQHVVLTRASTVQGALQASNLKINPQDVVEPSRTTKLKSDHEDVIIYRSRMVAIVDGSVRQNVVTADQSANAIAEAAKLPSIGPKDTTSFSRGELASEGTPAVLTIKRVKEEVAEVPKGPPPYVPLPNALTAGKGAQVFVDSQGVAHRETYYDLPMNVVMRACGGGTYTIRSDGAKIDKDGYVLVAANLRSYPRCSVVETSLGPGKVYDTGGFAVRHPYGFDLATDWTNYNGV